MHSFDTLSTEFNKRFAVEHFPAEPNTLYNPNRYFLEAGGKRVRPVAVLMGNELFGEINNDSWLVGNAIELFHNFTLIHDDIIDAAPLRRGRETLHIKYGLNTALLAGDVMLVKAYDYLNKIDNGYLKRIVNLFGITAREVCEGQQLDFDFETSNSVSIDEYINMITLKTSVLLAASLKIGAIIGGASVGNTEHIYEFGKNLGIAFQIQDDYLDAFGDPEKFGKQVGGDIIANKKTFLWLHAMANANAIDKAELENLMHETTNIADKVTKVLKIYKRTKSDVWANELKETYLNNALQHLEDTAVMSNRKQPLKELAAFLIMRQH